MNYNGSTFSDINSITLGKFPICSYQNNMYNEWIKRNSVNVGNMTITADDINLSNALFSNDITMGNRLLSGDILGGIGSVWNMFTDYSYALMKQKEHRMIPASVEGQLNSADVNVASGRNTFHFYKMSIKREYAQIIDDYFSAYGYKVNELKIPNLTGRLNWNFLKLINPNIEGTEIPEFELNEYKKQLMNGITFWHNPQTFRDYSQNNNIV